MKETIWSGWMAEYLDTKADEKKFLELQYWWSICVWPILMTYMCVTGKKKNDQPFQKEIEGNSIVLDTQPHGQWWPEWWDEEYSMTKKNLNLSIPAPFSEDYIGSQCFLFISFSSKRFGQIPFLYPVIPQCVHTTNFAASCALDYCFGKKLLTHKFKLTALYRMHYM